MGVALNTVSGTVRLWFLVSRFKETRSVDGGGHRITHCGMNALGQRFVSGNGGKIDIHEKQKYQPPLCESQV
jgi:hypothetical protein